ncbi:MAG: patatin-like phospholipase family protein [Kiritimatiellae bacterium]|nr:patatin-like phospholipase family protein [Kiritimatiellia bacterium]MCO5068459.1 patatin-like phospholipase family protein [Kiritimatiellia bacterium]
MPIRFRILSFDGGGIRGLLSIILLQRLENEIPGWLEKVNLLAGTSTGGILALGLAFGVPLAQLRELYEKKGPAIFDDSWLDNLKDLGNAVGAQYGNKALTRELKAIFGEAKLKDIKKRVLVPAFDLDNECEDPAKRSWAPKFFHNFPGPDSDGDRLAYKVALYTSAAPTFFPSVDGYIDGGVFANNPSMAALAQTQDHRALKDEPAHEEIALLSVGTGHPLMRIEKKTLDWGQAQWIKPLLNIMMDGVSGVADYQCRQILGETYHRLAPVFPPDKVIGLDDVDRIPDLVKFAESVDIAPAVSWLKSVWS